jgi:hypothetical protein
MLQLSRQILPKKTTFTQTYAAFFETFQQMTRLSSLAISMLKQAYTQYPGNVYLENTASETAITMGAYYLNNTKTIKKPP